MSVRGTTSAQLTLQSAGRSWEPRVMTHGWVRGSVPSGDCVLHRGHVHHYGLAGCRPGLANFL